MRWRMAGVAAVVAAAAAPLSSSPALAQAVLPEEVEVALALSALPEHLRDSSTVYLYRDGQGMVEARVGTNGFHAMVSRVEPAVFRGDWEYTAHRDDVLLPIAFDAAGARGPMLPFLDANELIARGTSPRETKRLVRQRFEEDAYPPAARVGVAFMLAPVMRAYPNPEGDPRVLTLNVPHRMFYAPHVTNEDIGGRPGTGTQPFVIQPGVHGYIGQRAGPAEVETVNREHAMLIRRLCELDERWCLPHGGG